MLVISERDRLLHVEALFDGFLEQAGEVEVVLHAEFVQPGGQRNALGDAAFGLLLADDVHANGHEYDGFAFLHIDFVEGGWSRDMVSITLGDVKKTFESLLGASRGFRFGLAAARANEAPAGFLRQIGSAHV